MAIQVLAIRVERGDDLLSVVELIYRDDDGGRIGTMDREKLAEWVNDNPTVRVYVRDHVGDNQPVLSFLHNGRRYLRVGEEVSKRDRLLRLPRFITATSRPESNQPACKEPAARDPLLDLLFWWLPRS